MTENIKEDFLEVDSKIPGQNYVCLSFVSPEKILKRKETFFTTKFLEYLFNDEEMVAHDIREKMLNKTLKIDHQNVEKLYEDWKYSRNDDLESQFFELNDYNDYQNETTYGVLPTYILSKNIISVLPIRSLNIKLSPLFVNKASYILGRVVFDTLEFLSVLVAVSKI